MENLVKEHRRKPVDSDFKQQRLPAWNPFITDRVFYIVLFSVAIAFLAVGIPMLVESNKVVERSWDYTDCVTSTGESCAVLLANSSGPYSNATSSTRCTCTIPVSLTGFGSSKVSLFYGLGNYYQDHRFYVQSRWEPQLRSTSITGGPECKPYIQNDAGLFYVPCGLVANSIFNDTIQMFHYPNNAAGPQVGLSGRHITWESDRGKKYKNPTTTTPLCSYPDFAPTKVTKPPNWPVQLCELGTDTSSSGRYNPWAPAYGSEGLGYENEDFIVWMRLSSTATFRKLYRYVVDPLPDGDYAFVVEYNYPVTQFSGTKYLTLSTESWMNGKNPFLGALYIVIACISLVTAVLFLLMSKPRDQIQPHW